MNRAGVRMTTLAESPPAKSKPAFSWFGGFKPPVEKPQVLIRLRDLNQPVEVRREPVTLEIVATPPKSEPDHIAEFARIPATESHPSELESIESPTESKSIYLAEEPSTAPETSNPASPDAEPLTPAKRQRQRREAAPAQKDWSPTIWQGAIGLALVSLFVLVYFIMMGGGKKPDTASPGKNADGAPASSELETPEISIPESSTGPAELATSHPLPDKDPSPSKSGVAKDLKSGAVPDSSTEPDDSGEGFGPPPTHPGEYPGRPAAREAKKPRGEENNYPVTPAQMTYPATDPGKFRYPDDTRPSEPRDARGEGQYVPRSTSRGGEWNEDDRLGVGRRGIPEQSPNKLR